MMWQTTFSSEANGRILKFAISNEHGPLTRVMVLTLWRDDANFRAHFAAQLAAVPFTSFRWETPETTRASLLRPFECVVLDSPGLAPVPDAQAFAPYFKTHARDGVAVFPNLGKDATLIVPCPLAGEAAYAHLAAFLRQAPPAQVQTLWQRVGATMLERVSDVPVWLSTAGAGVSWLHVRLAARPKYYGYAAYKRDSA